MFCECGNKSRDVVNGGPCASCEHQARRLARMKEKKAASDAKRIQRMKDSPRRYTPIAKVSKKQLTAVRQYLQDRGPWLEGKMCRCKGCYQKAVECHHMKGRKGYADQWARDNGIKLINDKRFWFPACSLCHKRITDDSGWALENGYSFKRSA